MRGVIVEAGASKKLNQLAREQLKHKILADILMDMNICKIENWDVTEFTSEIIEMLNTIKNNYGKGNNSSRKSRRTRYSIRNSF